ncbi:hypothetical protein [Blastococcus sp. TF02-09]|uniref:dCTP deaminase domain-containing protein n=1 Tax=Blastococcus sp. TF02-09 TaxID=2250576 RepID=UPI0011BDC855|nr:hypothetical protein [Blastococcus sp. TF02-9]
MFTRQGLLAGERLKTALTDPGERIFRLGSWSHENVRGAGYDLRIATDLMVVPAPGGHVVYERGVHRHTEVILAPGETALFSTMERVSLDWDIAGNLGAKFSLLARGLMILTGLAVDPGYGRERLPNGVWAPADDTRLNFLVANVGSDSVSLRPGTDSIAVLQLFEVANAERREVSSEGFDALKDRLFTDTGGGTGLAYFQSVLSVRTKLAGLEQRVAAVNETVSRVQNASNALVSFGVYLVSSTILAAISAFLIETVPGALDSSSSVESWIVWMIIGVVCLSMVAVSIAALVAVFKAVGGSKGSGDGA